MSNERVLLINKRGLLIDKRVLIRKIDFKATSVYNLKFVKWINYKAKDLIEFKKSKKFNSFDLFLDFFFNLFY